MEDLRKKFPLTDYLLIEDKQARVYVFDRSIPALRLHVTREMVLRAFLEKADSLGVVRWGDLTDEIKDAALELFVSAALAIKKMGKQADDVRISLETSLYIEANSPTKSVGAHSTMNLDQDKFASVGRELRAHGVTHYEIPSSEWARYSREETESARLRGGLSFRFWGLPLYSFSTAVPGAIEALHDYLKSEQARLEPMYDELADRFAARALADFGGRAPAGTIEKSQVPYNVWRPYENALKLHSTVYGFADRSEAEEFLLSIQGVNVKVEYTMSYFEMPYTDKDGNRAGGYGMSIVLIRK